MNPARNWRPLAALVLLSLIWGYTWVAVKQGLAFAPPVAFAAQRSLGGALVLFVVLKCLRQSLRLEAPRTTLILALLQVTAFSALQNWALIEGGAGKTAVLNYTMPIWTLMLTGWVLGERVRGGQWLAAACTLIGLVLIIEPWNLQGSVLSKVLGLLAALCWAIANLIVKRLLARQKVNLVALTAWQLLLGSLPLAVLSLVMAEAPTAWDGQYLAILAFLAFISTGLCWWLWAYILNRLPAWEASLSVLGAPVVALISSRLLLGEEFRITEVAGILLIGCGLGMLSLVGWLFSRRHT